MVALKVCIYLLDCVIIVFNKDSILLIFLKHTVVICGRPWLCIEVLCCLLEICKRKKHVPYAGMEAAKIVNCQNCTKILPDLEGEWIRRHSHFRDRKVLRAPRTLCSTERVFPPVRVGCCQTLLWIPREFWSRNYVEF